MEKIAQGDGGISHCMRELSEEIDRGWRYFWRKRGYAEPPPLSDDQFMFRNEKNALKKNKQKEAERISGIQKAWREFLGKQIL